jgi:hypothetical protein
MEMVHFSGSEAIYLIEPANSLVFDLSIEDLHVIGCPTKRKVFCRIRLCLSLISIYSD